MEDAIPEIIASSKRPKTQDSKPKTQTQDPHADNFPDGKALQKPVVSPDGKFLAVIAADADESIYLINLAEAAHGRRHRYITAVKVKVSKSTSTSTRPFLKECSILRWSPETMTSSDEASAEVRSKTNTNTNINTNTTSRSNVGTTWTWMLLSNGSRVVAVSTDLPGPSPSPMLSRGGHDETTMTMTKPDILADYELGTQYGKLSLVEYVFDHRHALVMFEFGTTAAILSLVKPQRDEIAHVKFSDSRSFAASPDARYFALLRRDRSQDRVSVFGLEEEGNYDNNDSTSTSNKYKYNKNNNHNSRITYKSFDVPTLDAQNLTWCPSGGNPLLAVCDSPAYGARICFFTAQGHALRQLDISSATLGPDLDSPFTKGALRLNMEGVGVTFWKWSKAKATATATATVTAKATIDSPIQTRIHQTIQAVADGRKRVLVRSLPAGSMVTQPLASFSHPELVDGSHAFVWQEQEHEQGQEGRRVDSTRPGPASIRSSRSSAPEFTRHTGIFEVTQPQSQSQPDTAQSRADQARDSQVDMVAINSDQTVVVTRLRSAPRTLFLWKLAHPHSHLHTVLIFSHAVRQTLWHPWLPDVLLIVTARKSPRVYVWCRETLPPISGLIPLDTSKSTNFSGCWLPQCLCDDSSKSGKSKDDDRSKSGNSKDDDSNISENKDDYGSRSGNSDDRRKSGNRKDDENDNDNNKPNLKPCPFLMSSSSCFNAGTLASVDGQVVFESILDPPEPDRDTDREKDTDIEISSPFGNGVGVGYGYRTGDDDDEDTTDKLIDTPSRGGRAGVRGGVGAGLGLGLGHKHKQALFDGDGADGGVQPNSRTGPDDPEHVQQARYWRW
ncbi:hypothetical protein A1O3_01147 [Capronia epimyces CBS 606.96]|uniref:Uncharacterized protein n=1 Tax=Capronia epimyces CBS 606.96 TaxID=1182542 RepID=W9YSF6_9EURO|nr:uncharacterized protein A1O3_01147 [Capronia epimyces CBS 606.96]EXJ92595.1 hypothetical protein A1O3_01147 [Capronia epimyces CBS 606.96]